MTDLDALTALLAAAKTGNHADVVVYRHRILEAAPALIEAARREADAHRYVEMNRDVWDDNPNDPLGARQLSAAYRDIYQKVLNVLEGRQPLDNAGAAER